MKCKYCGNNLGIEDEFCPHCGKENSQAAKHIADMKNYKEDYDRTKDEVIEKSTKFNSRVARIAIIAVLILIVAVLLIINDSYSDFEKREKMSQQKIAKELEKNKKNIGETLKEMEIHRDYLAMDYFILNHSLRSDEEYNDYARVFTAVIDYGVIHSDILNIVDGFDNYGKKSKRDWCDDIAIYVSQWENYVEGRFWNDTADSPMHAGEHGAFLADAKKDTQDMIQVYFELSDSQAEAIWSMEQEEIGDMLYEKCLDLYPEVEAHE